MERYLKDLQSKIGTIERSMEMREAVRQCIRDKGILLHTFAASIEVIDEILKLDAREYCPEDISVLRSILRAERMHSEHTSVFGADAASSFGLLYHGGEFFLPMNTKHGRLHPIGGKRDVCDLSPHAVLRRELEEEVRINDGAKQLLLELPVLDPAKTVWLGTKHTMFIVVPQTGCEFPECIDPAFGGWVVLEEAYQHMGDYEWTKAAEYFVNYYNENERDMRRMALAAADDWSTIADSFF